MTTARFAYNEPKFCELLVHLAHESAGDPNFGKTKMNKLLYYIDFAAYRSLGTPVTGASYQRRPYGPVPKEIPAARAKLTAEGALGHEVTDRFGFRQERYVALRPPDVSVFSAPELQIIDDVLTALRSMNGMEVSDLSHQAVGWRVARPNAVIPYESAFLSPNQEFTSDEVTRAQEIYAELQSAGTL